MDWKKGKNSTGRQGKEFAPGGKPRFSWKEAHDPGQNSRPFSGEGNEVWDWKNRHGPKVGKKAKREDLQ